MDHRGVSAVAGAITLVLERLWTPGLLDGVTPAFQSYQSEDFADPMRTGLSVFVHRVAGAPQLRRVPQRDGPERPGVSVEVHFLLTAWAESAPLEQSLLGWGATVLAEHPVMDSSLLNEAAPGVCGPDESIHVRAQDDHEVGHLWQALPRPMPLSLSFVTSAVHLVRGGGSPVGRP